MNTGYARVSTADQNLAPQTDALEKAECEKLYWDTASGALEDRKGLTDAIEWEGQGTPFPVLDGYVPVLSKDELY